MVCVRIRNWDREAGMVGLVNGRLGPETDCGSYRRNETAIFVINREIVPFSRRCNALGQVMNQGKVWNGE